MNFENKITDYYTNDDMDENTFRWWKDYLIKIDETEKSKIMKQFRIKLRFYKSPDIKR